MTGLSDRLRPGVMVILHPRTRSIGRLLRAGDLDRVALLAAADRVLHGADDSQQHDRY